MSTILLARSTYLIVYSHLSNFSATQWLSPLCTSDRTAKDLCFASMAFSSEGSFTCKTRSHFIGLIRRSGPYVQQRDLNPLRQDRQIFPLYPLRQAGEVHVRHRFINTFFKVCNISYFSGKKKETVILMDIDIFYKTLKSS
jgi:hypothetical protein